MKGYDAEEGPSGVAAEEAKVVEGLSCATAREKAVLAWRLRAGIVLEDGRAGYSDPLSSPSSSSPCLWEEAGWGEASSWFPC